MCFFKCVPSATKYPELPTQLLTSMDNCTRSGLMDIEELETIHDVTENGQFERYFSHLLSVC